MKLGDEYQGTVPSQRATFQMFYHTVLGAAVDPDGRKGKKKMVE